MIENPGDVMIGFTKGATLDEVRERAEALLASIYERQLHEERKLVGRNARQAVRFHRVLEEIISLKYAGPNVTDSDRYVAAARLAGIALDADGVLPWDAGA